MKKSEKVTNAAVIRLLLSDYYNISEWILARLYDDIVEALTGVEWDEYCAWHEKHGKDVIAWLESD